MAGSSLSNFSGELKSQKHLNIQQTLLASDNLAKVQKDR